MQGGMEQAWMAEPQTTRRETRGQLRWPPVETLVPPRTPRSLHPTAAGLPKDPLSPTKLEALPRRWRQHSLCAQHSVTTQSMGTRETWG